MIEFSVDLPFLGRRTAGQVLSQSLGHYRNSSNAIVLALPRGGVPVAKEVATALGLPLEILLVRKIGVPGHEELAMGAIASNNVLVWNDEFVRKIPANREITGNAIRKARQELERQKQLYCGNRPLSQIENRCVILVDDGLATGASMRAAVEAVRSQKPERIIVAVPVASPDSLELLRKYADEVVCPAAPEPFHSVAEWYIDFTQLTDMDVCELLDN